MLSKATITPILRLNRTATLRSFRAASGGPFSNTSRKEQADAGSTTELPPQESPAAATGGMANRFLVTAEVTVSKIFPAGFGWQSASVVADGMGMQADSFNFAVTTGAGDAVGYVVW